MEEAKLVQPAPTQIPNRPSSVEAPPSLPPKTKKRPPSLDSNAHISNSTYFKIRAVLMFLRFSGPLTFRSARQPTKFKNR
ncbi:hypothetical protein M0R45_034417 [Rubus argutus]|uniref:Uncharacterized protein n=1 Tax=Rubus argutus TaxID=59490 RepID=A0AAW1VQX7_RUBAR